MSDKLRYFFFSIAVVGFFALIFAVHPFVGAGGASLIVVVYLIAMHRLYDIIDEECCGRVDPWPPRESGEEFEYEDEEEGEDELANTAETKDVTQ